MDANKIFHLVLIRTSHYDNEGYVLQWVHASTPSNTLATLYGLAQDCADRKILGDDVQIKIHVFDETVNRIKFKQLINMIQASGGHGLVALCGVQSNQFPRAFDIACHFRKADIQVCIGGFHVSGTLAMLPSMPAELQEAIDKGISLFAGEAEWHFDKVLQDAMRQQMKPIYNYIGNLADLNGVPHPFLPADHTKRAGGKATVDAGRGCPFVCSFCTVINVHGNQSRFRSADDIEELIRVQVNQGINSFLITDDNFARNKNWEPICDRLIELREKEGIELRLSIQVDTLSHRTKNFIDKASRAGVNRVFIGMENINPESLKEVNKGQNSIKQYRTLLQAWQNAGAVTHVGYILGFPIDTPDSIARDIEIIKRELPIDVLDFFILTPLPGSMDHKNLYESGIEMDDDLNKYDLCHVLTQHSNMTKQEWYAAFNRAWKQYYTPEHVETIMRRAHARGEDLGHVTTKLTVFGACLEIEGVHPLDAGLIRRKYRKDRRAGMPLENPLIFYPRYLLETLRKYTRLIQIFVRYNKIRRLVERDPKAKEYTDLATAKS